MPSKLNRPVESYECVYKKCANKLYASEFGLLVHYLEKRNDKEEQALRLLRESQRKSFLLKGLIAKKETFNDERSISFVQKDLRRIVEHKQKLRDIDAYSSLGRAGKAKEEKKTIQRRLTSLGINNLGSTIKGTVFGKPNSTRDKSEDPKGESIDLEELGVSPALSKRNTEILSSPGPITSKRVKVLEKRNHHPVSVFRNLNL